MLVSEMRDAISNVYNGAAWRNKVATMSDSQVIAVYHSFRAKGKFDKPKPTVPDKKIKPVDNNKIAGAEQLTIL